MSDAHRYAFRWASVSDLSATEKAAAQSDLETLTAIWREHATSLFDSQTLHRFTAQVKQRWTLETGTGADMGRPDRSVTEWFPDQTAFPANDETILDDLYDFAASGRPISTAYIKEIHQRLCAHPLETAADQDAHSPLHTGAWKDCPNHHVRRDGRMYACCPPDQVEGAMEQLVAIHLAQEAAGLSAAIKAAWLHHRFTQIQPFEHGNGQVARALATLMLLRAGLFPFLVERSSYKACLEKADEDSLTDFIAMIARMQRRLLATGLSLSEGLADAAKDVEALIQNGARILESQHAPLSGERYDVYQIAGQIEGLAYMQLSAVAHHIREALQQVDHDYLCSVTESDAATTLWFHEQALETARHLGCHADLRHYHHWVRLRIAESKVAGIVVSVHPLGKVFRGVMAASAFYEERPRDLEEHCAPSFSMPLDGALFPFTYNEAFDKTSARFEQWLDETVRAGLALWCSRL